MYPFLAIFIKIATFTPKMTTFHGVDFGKHFFIWKSTY